MRISIASAQGTRSEQQDCADSRSWRNHTTAIVADGMGGMYCGSAAARIAVVTLIEEPWGPAEAQARFERAHTALRAQLGTAQRAGAAVTVALIEEDLLSQVATVHLVWVGDVQAYHYVGTELRPLLTPHRWSHSVLLRCLSNAERPEPEVAGPFRLHPGEKLLLATDGLWDVGLSPDALLPCLRRPARIAAPALVRRAEAAPHYGDNATALVAETEWISSAPPLLPEVADPPYQGVGAPATARAELLALLRRGGPQPTNQLAAARGVSLRVTRDQLVALCEDGQVEEIQGGWRAR